MDSDIEQFLIYLQQLRGLSERSLRAYRTDLKQWEAFLQAEGMSLLEVDFQTAGGYLLERRKKGLSPAAVNRSLGALRGFYRYLLRMGKIRANPFSGLKSLKNPRTLPRVLKQKELLQLIQSLPPDFEGVRDKFIFLLLYSTGCRASEILNLTTKTIQDAVDRFKILGKGKKERVVFLTDEACKVRDEYLALREKIFGILSHPFLFVNRTGEPLTASMLGHNLKKRLLRAGIIHKVTPHTFRHTFATDILSNGADIRQVQELLGHSQISTTQIYTHVGIERLRKILKEAHPHGGLK